MCARFCTSLCEIESCRHFFPKCGPYLDRLPYVHITTRTCACRVFLHHRAERTLQHEFVVLNLSDFDTTSKHPGQLVKLRFIISNITLPPCAVESCPTHADISGGISPCCLLSRVSHFMMFRPIGLYRDVWIAAIASSRTRLATLTGAMCKTSQCELRSLRVNSGMLNVIRIVTYYTLPPLESPDSFWIAMAISR